MEREHLDEHIQIAHAPFDERPKPDPDEFGDDGEELPGDRGDDAELEIEGGPAALVRLNKYLADHGVASRRRCDELIQSGQVMVDGTIVTELGTKIDPEAQKVEIDGFVLQPKGLRKRYYLLNKPSGVVCTNENRELRPRAVDLITDPRKGRIYTVGRLDEESKGLILLTNDGEFAQRIMHPKHGVEKTYLVRVRGKIDDEALQKIRNGIHLSEGRTSGARVLVHERQRDSSWLSVTIHEGMNREIRRSFARVGFKVLELKRTRIGPLGDRGLKIGRWRELTRAEIDALVRGAPKEGAKERPLKSKRPPRTFSGKGGFVVAQERRAERRSQEPDARPRRGSEFERGGFAPRRGSAGKARSTGGSRAGSSGGSRGGPRGDRSGGQRSGPGNSSGTAGTRGSGKTRGSGGLRGSGGTRGPDNSRGLGKPAFGGAPRRGTRGDGPKARDDRPRGKSSFPAPMRRPANPERDEA